MIMKYDGILPSILLSANNQIYISPSLVLRDCIAHYTISFSSKTNVCDTNVCDTNVCDTNVSDTLTLIPDASGCLIFSYNGSNLTSKLWGATTKTTVVKNDVNRCPMRLFIEFLPGGLYSLTGIKQTDLTDIQLPVNEIIRSLHTHISDAFESADDVCGFIDRLNAILCAYMKNTRLPNALLSSIEHIRQHKGCLSVRKLADMEFYSERHLNRLFNEHVGMNAKTFSNIIRINYVVKRMNEGHCPTTDRIQIDEFYDQSHFIHAFKLICGTTPKKYCENMSEFYNEPFKF